MVDFFIEGGWGMWPILVFGLVLLGASVRFAQKPSAKLLRFVVAMGVTVLVTSFHATWTDFGAVFNTLSDPARVPDHEVVRTFFVGLKECTRPGAFGGAVLTLAAVLVSVGVLRQKDE